MFSRWARVRAATVVAAAAAAAVGLAPTAVAAVGDGGPVSPIAATWTPSLATSGTDGSVERIRKIEQCGSTMYAVGLFSSIKQKVTTYARNNAFSFSATTGAMTGWAPSVNGQVNSIVLSADCATAYLGGTFTAINGTAVKNIAAVSTFTGNVVPTFASTAGGAVNTLAMSGNHLLVGGRFTSINGSTKKYLVSLNPSTGKDDGYVNLVVSGTYVYTDDGGATSKGNYTQVYNFAPSPDGARLLAMGVFTSVGGHARRQIVMLDLGATSVTVNPWYSQDFDQNCHIVEPFYLQDATWSPDTSEVYVATTGYKAANGLGYRTSDPRGNLTPGAVTNICDAAAAYPSGPSSQQRHNWVNYTGCDSLYSVAADSSAVYTGGHHRWADNPGQCDNNNNGTAVVSPGMSGLTLTGSSILDGSGGLVNRYNKGRGLGATDMVVTSAGLWIASDNQANVDSCGKTSTGAIAHGHKGLCFLPYS